MLAVSGRIGHLLGMLDSPIGSHECSVIDYSSCSYQLEVYYTCCGYCHLSDGLALSCLSL